MNAAAQRSAFVALIAAEVAERGISLRQVAREAGVNPTTLHRLMHEKDVMAEVIFKLWGWLDQEKG
jgi:lambda repressor-like predicted transcriptional regulator